MSKKYTRREFNAKVAGAAAAPQILDDEEEDDEQSFWEKYFGDDETSSNEAGAVYVVEEAAGELETINPGDNEIAVAKDTGGIFKPTDEGKWQKFATLGESPWTKTDSGALTPKEGGAVSIDRLSNIEFANEHAESGSGTKDDLWLNGITNAIDAIPDDEWGAIAVPAGHYGQTEQIDMRELYRPMRDTAASSPSRPIIPVAGAGRWATNVYASDGDGTYLNDNLVHYGLPTDIEAENNILPTYFGGMTLWGERDASSDTSGADSGSGLYFDSETNKNGNNYFSNGVWRDLYIREFPDHSIHIPHGDVIESMFYNVDLNRATGVGFLAEAPITRNIFSGCKFNICDSSGMDANAERCWFYGCEWRSNNDHGLILRNNQNAFVGCQWNNNARGDTDKQILCLNNGNSFSGFVLATNESPAVQDQGNDNDYDLKMDEYTFDVSGATRPRWDGVIGGGPLGGVDVGSIDTTAIHEGVEAVADGTTQTAGHTYRRFGGSWVDT